MATKTKTKTKKTSTKKTPKTIDVTFAMERETKNTFRFAEVNGDGEFLDQQDAIVGTLYVKKSALDGETVNDDTTLTVTIAVG